MIYNVLYKIKVYIKRTIEVIVIDYSKRQSQIIEIVKREGPITSDGIAGILQISKNTIRSDLQLLSKMSILEAKPKVGYQIAKVNQLGTTFKAFLKMSVKDIMSVPTVLLDTVSVYDAIVAMFLEDTDSIYVLSGGYLGGVISRKDIIKTALGNVELKEIPIGVIMTRMPNVYYIYSEQTLIEAARILVEHEIDSLPVVEKEIKTGKEEYKVVGKVSKTVINNLVVELGEQLEG